jgi:Protein of unknown function (DUF3306)
MRRAEGFLSRWSRRKRESEREAHSEPSPGPSDADVTPVGAGGEAFAPAEEGEPAPAAFDPASLPPIESISGSTDIRSFLLSGVPAALTQAALRRAWTTDPAICNFIGIAENQWDFTDPTGIPGFGPLTAADEISGTAGQMLATAEDGLAQIADISLPAGPPAPAATDDARGSAIAAGEDKAAQAAAAREEPSGAPEADTSRDPRTHGGALPR